MDSKEQSSTFLVSDVINFLGMNKTTLAVFFLAGIGMLLDGFDYMIVSYTMPQISADWELDPVLTGSLTTWSAIGLMVGSIVGGSISDRFGRRRTMLGAVLVFSAFTLPVFIAPNFAVFAVLRICAGFGMGAFFPVLATTVSEFSPDKYRALLTALGAAFQALGWVVAGLVASAVVPIWGWRECYIAAGIGLLFCIVLFFTLPESPYWLAQKGEKAKAIEVLKRMCAGSKKLATERFDLTAQNLAVPPKPQKVGVSALFTQGRTRITIGFWIIYFLATFIVYGINPWLPTLLLEKGSNLATSYGFSIASNSAAVISGLIVGFVVEALGRKRGMAVGFGLAIIGIGVMALIGGGSDTVLLMAIMFMGLCINYMPGSIVPGCAESYPTMVRNTGVGWMQSMSRVAGIVSPLFVGALVTLQLDFSQVFLVYTIPAVLGIIAVFVFIKKDTKGTVLDETASAD